jgi:Flp pilus assembly protein TadG
MLSIMRSRRAAFLRHKPTRRRGQALVEFAIVSILMVLILATVADFGRLFYAQITVENAARSGAIVAARDPSSYTGACPAPTAATNKIGCAIVAESRGSGTTVAPSEISVVCENLAGTPVACATAPQGNVRSRVTIVKRFGFIMPILSAFFGSGITMTASVTADQQSLPPDATFVPVPSASAAPTASPSPSPSPSPSASASASPSPSPSPTATPAPCIPGFAPVPNLVVGATPGSTETVDEARAEWVTAGFSLTNFNPNNGSTNKIVLTQVPNDVGFCMRVTTYAVTVTHS